MKTNFDPHSRPLDAQRRSGVGARAQAVPSPPAAAATDNWVTSGTTFERAQAVTVGASKRELESHQTSLFARYWGLLSKVMGVVDQRKLGGANLSEYRDWLLPIAQAIDPSPEARAALLSSLGPEFLLPNLLATLQIDHPYVELRVENLLTLPLRYGPDSNKDVALVTIAIYTDKDDPSKPLVWAMWQWAVAKDGTVFCKRENLFRDIDDPRIKGILTWLTPKDDILIKASGVVHSELEAWYLGRGLWPLLDYDFKDPSTLTELKDGLRRFMQSPYVLSAGITEADLRFDRGEGVVEPFSFAALQTARDFTQITAVDGNGRRKTIGPIDLWVGEQVVREGRNLDVGNAFLYSNPHLGFAPESFDLLRLEPAAGVMPD